MYKSKTKNSFHKAVSGLMLVCFFSTSAIPASYAQEIFLPALGTMVHLSPAFAPPLLKGLKVHMENPFLFDFILDNGAAKNSSDEEKIKLVKYFLAALTTPENEMWVNLSPYEKDRIVPESFGQTEMGRDLLAQDYLLKQITASLIYPENELGKEFWDRIKTEAQKKFGTIEIPVNTFNKVWIVPDKSLVYENPQSAVAYVLESTLTVMLEEDYKALNMSSPQSLSGDPQLKNGSSIKAFEDDKGATNALGSQIVREIVIPALIKEVNEGKNFAQLRQVYNSLILAAWYKKRIKDSILSQVYVDKNKFTGVNIDDPNEKQQIYEQYLTAFKKGAYNYIKEEADPVTQEMIPKKYFSGGFAARLNLQITTSDPGGFAAQTSNERMEVALLNANTKSGKSASSSLIDSIGQSYQLPKEKLEEIERQLNDAIQKGERQVDSLLGFTRNVKDKEKKDILRTAIINMHPDRFLDDDRKLIADQIVRLLNSIRQDLKDEKDGLFRKDDGSFFGQPDAADLHRIRVIRQIKDSFWEKLASRDHVVVPRLDHEQGDIQLYPVENYLRWRGKDIKGIPIKSERSLLGVILINDANEIVGVSLDYDYFPNINHGTNGDSLFIKKRMKLVAQLSQEPFIALYFLNQLNGFRNFIQAIPMHARAKLSFSFDVLGTSSLFDATTLGAYQQGFGIFVPLDRRLTREDRGQMGTFSHEFQHLYSDAMGDSYREKARQVEHDRDLQGKLEKLSGFFRTDILSKEMISSRWDDFLVTSVLAFIQKWAQRWGVPENLIPKELELALNSVRRLHAKTGKHVWALIREYAKKHNWFMTGLNDWYYISPNEWLSMKAQYYLAHDNESWLYNLFKDNGIENEFLTEEDIAFFRERYGETAYVRYNLMEARSQENSAEIQKWEKEWDSLGQGMAEFALPSIYEMLAFLNGDVIFQNLSALVVRLANVESGDQVRLGAAISSQRTLEAVKYLLPSPEINTEENRSALKAVLQTYQYPNDLRGLLEYIDNREFSGSLLIANFHFALQRNSKVALKDLKWFLSENRGLIEKRIKELEEEFVARYQEQMENVRSAIASLTNLETVEMALASVEEPVFKDTGKELQYMEISDALRENRVVINNFYPYREGMFLLLRQVKDTLRKRLETLRANFLTDNGITQEKVFAAIRSLDTIGAVQLVLNLSDEAVSNPWSSAQYGSGGDYQKVVDAFGNQGMNLNKVRYRTHHDFARILRLTQARPMIIQRMRELSVEFARLEGKAGDALAAISETRPLLAGIGTSNSGLSDSRALQPVHSTTIQLSSAYTQFEEQLQEVRELLLYKSDPEGREYIRNRLNFIIEESRSYIQSLSQVEGEPSLAVQHALEKIISTSQEILSQVGSSAIVAMKTRNDLPSAQ